MKLKIRNFQIIESADIQFNGLTVIAGENDTGKTTIGKILFSEIRNILLEKNSKKIFDTKCTLVSRTNKICEIVFRKENENLGFPIIIDSPDFLSKFNYLKNTMVLSQQYQLNFSLPDEVGDLVLRISQPKVLDRRQKLFQIIKKLIRGEVYYDLSKDNIFYKKEDLKLDMDKTSNGVKMFGFLQILILNETIKEGSTLIFDEPEVHLHPKWQLAYAKIIVFLVKGGVKVLVTSHSPYMIEALELYARKENISAEFYLANKVNETSIIENVNTHLEKIYRKLAEPISDLEELDDAD